MYLQMPAKMHPWPGSFGGYLHLEQFKKYRTLFHHPPLGASRPFSPRQAGGELKRGRGKSPIVLVKLLSERGPLRRMEAELPPHAHRMGDEGGRRPGEGFRQQTLAPHPYFK
jgi:hypothetical protein